MDRSILEEVLSQLLQTLNEDFYIGITFLTQINGIFNVLSKNNKFFFAISITQDRFFQLTVPPGPHEIKSFNKEIIRIITDVGHNTAEDYPLSTQRILSTVDSIIENSNQGPIIRLIQDVTVRDLLAFDLVVLYQKYNLSHNLVDILSFDVIFLETDFVKGTIFIGRKTGGIFHNFRKDVTFDYKYIEKFKGRIQWYMMETKDFVSNSGLKL